MEYPTVMQYVRNKRGQKSGVVVALAADKIGWSLCKLPSSETDYYSEYYYDEWDREFGIMIAVNRAESGKEWISLLKERYPHRSKNPRIYRDLIPTIEKVKDRARRYFK